MFANRKRKSGMRRAYLKKTTYTRDSNPDETMKASIGLGRDINPIDATPHRARLWLDTHKHTPTLTQPMAEKLAKHNPSHFGLHIKPDPWHTIVCCNTSLSKIEMCFSGFNDRAIYFFRWEDRLSGTKRESYTMSKDTAVRYRNNGLKGVPWK